MGIYKSVDALRLVFRLPLFRPDRRSYELMSVSASTSEQFARYVFLVALGHNIHKKRKEQKLSQQSLAHISGIPRPYLSDLECGKRNVSFLTVVKIAGALDTSVSALAEGIP